MEDYQNHDGYSGAGTDRYIPTNVNPLPPIKIGGEYDPYGGRQA